MWDKKDRMDLIFGSSPGLTAMADPGYDLESDVDLGPDSNSEFDYDKTVEWIDEGTGGVGEEVVVDEAEEGLDRGRDMVEGEDQLSNSADSDSNSDSDSGEWEGVSTETYTDNSYDSVYGDWNDEDTDLNSKKRKKNLRIEDVVATYDTWVRCRDIIEEEIKTKIIPIFCDLDGVLVDFEAGVQKIFKNKKTAGAWVRKILHFSFIYFLFFIILIQYV